MRTELKTSGSRNRNYRRRCESTITDWQLNHLHEPTSPRIHPLSRATTSLSLYKWLLKRLSSRTRFYLEEEFLDTSDSLVRCVLHQSIIVFIQVLYANAMQMSKLNSLLEATRGSDKKDTSDLTIRLCPLFWLNYQMCPKSSSREKLVLQLRCLNHISTETTTPLGDYSFSPPK